NLNDDIIAKNLCGCSAMINGLSFVLALLSSAQSAYISFTTVSSPLNWVITSITTTSNVIFETYILAIIMRTSLEYLVSKLSNSSFYEKIIAIQEQLSKIQKIL